SGGVADMSSDPSLPTPHPPGSPAKIALLAGRAAAHLPLFLEGDAEGARQLAPRVRLEPAPSLRSERDSLLVPALNGKAQTPLELSLATGVPLRRVHHALSMLREAGVAEPVGRRGWRLCRLAFS